MFDQESIENNISGITNISFTVMEFLSNVIRKVKNVRGILDSFPDKKDLKEFIITNPVLHKTLKGFLWEVENIDKNMNS